MSSELQRARATADARQEAVQDALAREHAEALDQWQRAGFAEGERWSLGDAYRRLFVGFDLDVEELLDHAGREAEAAIDEAETAQRTGRPLPRDVFLRAIYLDGFTDASFLWHARDALPRRPEADRQASAFIDVDGYLDLVSAASELAQAAARAVTEPRRFLENEDERQWQLAAAIAKVRLLIGSQQADRQASPVDERRDYSSERGPVPFAHFPAWLFPVRSIERDGLVLFEMRGSPRGWIDHHHTLSEPKWR